MDLLDCVFLGRDAFYRVSPNYPGNKIPKLSFPNNSSVGTHEIQLSNPTFGKQGMSQVDSWPWRLGVGHFFHVFLGAPDTLHVFGMEGCVFSPESKLISRCALSFPIQHPRLPGSQIQDFMAVLSCRKNKLLVGGSKIILEVEQH